MRRRCGAMCAGRGSSLFLLFRGRSLSSRWLLCPLLCLGRRGGGNFGSIVRGLKGGRRGLGRGIERGRLGLRCI